jgi:hypothetical protein
MLYSEAVLQFHTPCCIVQKVILISWVVQEFLAYECYL